MSASDPIEQLRETLKAVRKRATAAEEAKSWTAVSTLSKQEIDLAQQVAVLEATRDAEVEAEEIGSMDGIYRVLRAVLPSIPSYVLDDLHLLIEAHRQEGAQVEEP